MFIDHRGKQIIHWQLGKPKAIIFQALNCTLVTCFGWNQMVQCNRVYLGKRQILFLSEPNDLSSEI